MLKLEWTIIRLAEEAGIYNILSNGFSWSSMNPEAGFLLNSTDDAVSVRHPEHFAMPLRIGSLPYNASLA